MIGAGAILRSGAILYADVQIGVNVLIGHHTLLRTGVQVGTETQLGHTLTVERATRIGRDVRCSPGSHITSSTVLADRVFLGAGVRTTANQAAAELALLLGAAGFRADSLVAKTCRDLGGLLYADGIHDSLYRAAGKQHTTSEDTVVPAPRGRSGSVPMTA